jgi:hypothetical protein
MEAAAHGLAVHAERGDEVWDRDPQSDAILCRPCNILFVGGPTHIVPEPSPHVQHESTFVMTEDGPVQLSDVVLPPNAVP